MLVVAPLVRVNHHVDPNITAILSRVVFRGSVLVRDVEQGAEVCWVMACQHESHHASLLQALHESVHCLGLRNTFASVFHLSPSGDEIPAGLASLLSASLKIGK